MHHFSLLVLAFLVMACETGQAQTHDAESAAPPARRAVAVTFDDLPAVAVRHGCNPDRLADFTARLLAPAASYAIPLTGFVVEGQVAECMNAEGLADILTMWLEAGAELGNHTYSHQSFDTVSLDTYTADIIRGETITKQLLAERGRRLRYFRHPMLRSGADSTRKDSLEAFLAERSYTVAPVTLDNDEWIFALAYMRASARDDSAAASRIGEAYVEYMDRVFAFYEQRSMDLLGYEVPQVLLLHANALNADYFDDLARMIRARGYAFISLEEALQDQAYERGNPYVGPRGLSWLQRWALAQGETIQPQPAAPDWVYEVAGL